MTVDQILSDYDRALRLDDGCARSAFCFAIRSLTGELWSWQSPPHVLTTRAGALISDRRDRSPARQEVIERSIIALSDRLRADLMIYVYDQADVLPVTFAQYALDNRADLQCEVALSKIWSGSWWAPVDRHSYLSLHPDLRSHD